MKKALVPLAPGCEEMEAVTLIDILRRGGVEVISAGLEKGPVTGSRGVRLIPDCDLDDIDAGQVDLVALPGGIPGADHLAEDARIGRILRRMTETGKLVGAVCAAPKALVRHGVLQGRTATAYPGVLATEGHADISDQAVVRDGTVISSRAAGTAMDFALELVEALQGRDVRLEVERGLIRD